MSGMMDKIFDRTMNLLHKDLDLRMQRAEAIVSNVANSETPGYRAVDVNFAGELKRALGQNSSALTQTNSRHLDTAANSGTAHTVADYSGTTRADGNNVDVDIQMGRLASNAGTYDKSANMLRKKIQLFKNALRYVQQ